MDCRTIALVAALAFLLAVAAPASCALSASGKQTEGYSIQPVIGNDSNKSAPAGGVAGGSVGVGNVTPVAPQPNVTGSGAGGTVGGPAVLPGPAVAEVDITVNSTQAQKASYLRNALGIGTTIMMEASTVEKLVTLKTAEPKRFGDIVSAAKSAADEGHREMLSNELAAMEPSFVERFSSKAANASEASAVREQATTYLEGVKTKKPATVRVEGPALEMLFAGQLTTDDFMRQLWNQ